MEHHLTGEKSYYDTQAKIMEQVLRSKSGKDTIIFSVHQLQEAYATLMSTPEVQNRIVEYRQAFKKAKAEGLSDHAANMYAMREARDLMDFMRAGRTIRFLNTYVPFLNAQVQGLARASRGIKEDPARFAKKWMIYSAAPTLLAYAYNAAMGKDNEEEYIGLPDYQRDLFYNFKVPGFGWIRIPKAFELGLAASGVERGLRSLRGDKQAWDGFTRSAAAVASLDVSTPLGAAAPIIEVSTNHDFFRDKAIVPPYEEDLDVDLRKGTKYASVFGKVAQQLFRVDSRVADHLINSYLGRVGRLATDAGKIGNPDSRVSLAKWMYHATGMTTDVPGYNSPDVQWVLDQAKRVGVRSVMKDQIDAVFSAKTQAQYDSASKALRNQAKQIRSAIESAASRTKPKYRGELIKAILEDM